MIPPQEWRNFRTELLQADVLVVAGGTALLRQLLPTPNLARRLPPGKWPWPQLAV